MWYYVQNNQRQGPVDNTAVATLIQSGAITRQTLVWKEGMANWVAADQTELHEHLRSAPPTVQPPMVPAPYGVAVATYTTESMRMLWLWYAWLTGLGLPLILLCIGIPMLIAATVLQFILLYRFWAVIQDGRVRSTPGKAVGFCFIPFFNLYWIFEAVPGLTTDMNTYLRERNIAVQPLSSGLAISWCVLTILTAIPYLGLLFIIPITIIEILLWRDFTNITIKILEHKQRPAV
ncbi:MAG: DUF4339 domain-containing protein [Kiritimatiellaeota bacterium]|nr:DUF4339 domain-containing protein [Kiritimatiellota bacterium]